LFYVVKWLFGTDFFSVITEFVITEFLCICIALLNVQYDLDQGSQTRGPRATRGPRTSEKMKISKILYSCGPRDLTLSLMRPASPFEFETPDLDCAMCICECCLCSFEFLFVCLEPILAWYSRPHSWLCGLCNKDSFSFPYWQNFLQFKPQPSGTCQYQIKVSFLLNHAFFHCYKLNRKKVLKNRHVKKYSTEAA